MKNASQAPEPILSKVSVSMISLKWGDVLSTFLPGVVALFALVPFFPGLSRLNQLNEITTAEGIGALIAAAIIGSILEAVTRVTWEKYWLVKKCPSKDILSNLNSTNVELYERGVQSSYKYVTFYANLAWATCLLLISHFYRGGGMCSLRPFILAALIILLLRASHVQWKYYVNYQNKVFQIKE